MELLLGLQSLGLTEKQARVYCCLLENGELAAGKLSELTRIERRSVYDALQALEGKGLAGSVVKQGARLFSANPLDCLKSLVSEKQLVLGQIMPLLQKKQSRKIQSPSIMVYHGKEGLRSIHEDILKENKDYFVYGGGAQAALGLKNYFPLWTKRRVRQGLKLNGIWIDTPEVRERVANQNPLLQARFIPKQYFSNVVWWLYSNKIVLVLYRDEPLAVLIESEDFARTYRNFFKLMWKVAKR